jgi:hypothetical protein
MFAITSNENQTENILDTLQNNCGYKQSEEGVRVDNLYTNYYIKSTLKHLKREVDKVIDIKKDIAGLQQDVIRVKPHDPAMAKKYGETLKSAEENLRGYKASALDSIRTIKVNIPESLDELGMDSFRITIVSPQDQKKREVLEQQKELIRLQKEFEELKREFERINK